MCVYVGVIIICKIYRRVGIAEAPLVRDARVPL